MNPEFILDENLRFVPKDKNALLDFVNGLQAELGKLTDIHKIVSLQGEIAVYLRTLDLFEAAEALKIRLQISAPTNQIESTQLALKKVKEKIIVND